VTSVVRERNCALVIPVLVSDYDLKMSLHHVVNLPYTKSRAEFKSIIPLLEQSKFMHPRFVFHLLLNLSASSFPKNSHSSRTYCRQTFL
jgi:hypothetical protein